MPPRQYLAWQTGEHPLGLRVRETARAWAKANRLVDALGGGAPSSFDLDVIERVSPAVVAAVLGDQRPGANTSMQGIAEVDWDAIPAAGYTPDPLAAAARACAGAPTAASWYRDDTGGPGFVGWTWEDPPASTHEALLALLSAHETEGYEGLYTLRIFGRVGWRLGAPGAPRGLDDGSSVAVWLFHGENQLNAELLFPGVDIDASVVAVYDAMGEALGIRIPENRFRRWKEGGLSARKVAFRREDWPPR